MKITIVGTGYVGLVTGTCFAEVGIDVTCIDIDRQKIEDLRQGIVPIFEPGLEEMVVRNLEKGRLHFSTDLASVLNQSEAIFIAVGTPPDEDGSADLSHVITVAGEIGRNMNRYLLVVNKSTVPVGTSDKVRLAVQEELDKRGVGIPFDMASNPEFLKEGAAVNDFLRPDRIVVGTDSEKAVELMKKLYKPFTLNGHPIIFMDITSAEMTKYAANAMLATKISFMNDIANLCELVGADVNQVRKGIGSDPRIGPRFIYPGTGYGGSCFPKDVKALIRTAEEYHYPLRILSAVDQVNEDQKTVLFRKMMHYYAGNLRGKKVTVWGLSFKPQTDDIREAPSLSLIAKLLEAEAHVTVYDPVAMTEARKKLEDNVRYADDQYEALENADCLAIITEWPEFRVPDFDRMSKAMKAPVVFDGRNIYDAGEMKKRSFQYFCIGLKANDKNHKA
ncbi:MAG: UDP-glucose/GDP-mannose dehydrogenase family protein [Bacteroidales bacterium]|nr:UDP-glucose/GDP-mannose dehydrogenase family protein [Bacteroidales bacterium]